MVIKFDTFNMARKPSVILCNPSGEELYALSGIKDRVATLRYNSVSEFSFTAIEKNTKGNKYDYYDLIQTTRVVKLIDIAEFVITNVIEVDNGIYKTKDVTCKSLEFDISQKGISIEEGTYKFYDSINPDKTIMNFIMEILPDWELGSIDSSLWNLYRTFEVIDKNVYEFMMSDVEEAFECIFIFDTVAKTISVKAIKNAVKETDIFLSHKNVIKSLDITEDSEEIKTGLNIYGADDITIRPINPIGGTTIYNFDYYKTTDWMPQDLIDAINAWEDKIKKATVQSNGILSDIKRANGELLTLTTQLTELKGQLKNLENIKAVRMEQGLDIADINKQIAKKQSEIDTKEQQIASKKEEIKRLKTQQNSLGNKLAIEQNFTKSQYKILTKFIKVGTYQNDTFVITDSMTEVEKQEVLEELFKVGKEVLIRVSQPKYTFNMEAVNFLNLFKYRKISQELELGSQITLGMNGNFRFAYPVLLEMTINYDDESGITLGFGNSLRLDKSDFTLAELFKEAVSVSSDVSFNKGKWGEGIKAKNQFNDYLNGSLNASLQEIINSDYQDILIDGSGIRCRRFNRNTNSFDPEQLWITGKSMVFSDDGFQTAKTALGRIRLPDGTYGYGINSEILLGKLIAGGQLVIENEGGTFMVDANGVTLKNANILVTNENGKEESLTDKVESVTNSKGELLAEKLFGQISAGKNNIECINPDNNKILKMNEAGIMIANSKTNGNWNWKTAITGDGIVADYIKANSTMTSVNFRGGTLDIGNGKFTVSNVGACVASDLTIKGGSIAIGTAFNVDRNGNVTINGGNINLGSGKFTVDTFGNVTATSINISGSGSVLDAKDMTVRNLVVGGNVIMGENAKITWSNLPDDVAGMTDVPTDTKIKGLVINEVGAKLGITHTTIGRAYIESPQIRGGSLVGTTVTQQSTDSRYSDGELVGGRLQFKKGSSYYGAVMGDAQDGKMWLEGNNALKLNAVEGDISLNPRSKYGETANGTIYLYGRVVVKGGEIVDEKNVPITGSAKFG